MTLTKTESNVWADWVTIWQSEMAALATDREVQEAIQRGVDLWAGSVLALGLMPGAPHEAGSAGAVAPPGTPAAAPASDGRERRPAEPGRD